MKRRSLLAIAVFILMTASAIALVWICIVPVYQAKSEVRVRPVIPRLVFQTDRNGLIPFYDAYVSTQVSIMKSPTILQRVLDQPEVQQTLWYKNPPKSIKQRLGSDPVPLLERLRDALKVQPRVRTEIIDITFTDPSAQDAKVIVNTVLHQYRQYIGKKSDEDEAKLYNKLSEEYQSLKEKNRGARGSHRGSS